MVAARLGPNRASSQGLKVGLLAAGPHHDGSALHVADDRPDLGAVVPVWLRVPRGEEPERAWVRSTPDAEPRYAPAVLDRQDEFESWFRADLQIRNPVTRYRWLLSGPGDAYRWLNGAGTHGYDVPDAHDFAISAYPAAPEWAVDATVYQIFPDRFARSPAADQRPAPSWAIPAQWGDSVLHQPPDAGRQLFGGDLEGIVERLDHVQSLGFNTLYLTPFFPAESTHRYNASSFDHVDPLLGGNEALARLARAVHDRGMRLVGDLTTNHAGSTHEWFVAARSDPAAPEREFFYFGDDGSYEAWLDVPTLPKLRFGPELHRRLLEGADSVVGRWLSAPYELDGWRIDVANMTGRRSADDSNLDVARAIRRTMLELRPDTLLVAEHCHDASGDLSGDGWHGAMNYAGFLRPLWAWVRSPGYRAEFLGMPLDVPRLGAHAMHTSMRAFQAVTPWRSLAASWSLTGSHDTARILTVTQNRDVADVARGVLFTFPGAPMVFMGDEIDGEGSTGEDARRPMPWRDASRFHTGTLQRYRDLAALRHSHGALRRGGLRWVFADDDVLAFLRESAGERLLCVAARAAHAPLRLPATLLALREGDRAANLYGGAADLHVRAGSVLATADGPTFQVWKTC
jgi:alpha-glucosidase